MLPSFFLNHDEHRLRAGWRIVAMNLMILIGLILMQVIFQPNLGWSTFLNTLVILPLVWWVGGWIDQRNPLQFGFERLKGGFVETLIGFCIGLTGIIALCLVGFQQGWMQVTGHIFMGTSLDSSTLWHSFLFLIAMCLVGLYEEVWSRGYIMLNMAEGFFSSKWSRAFAWFLAAIFSSLVFSLMHGANPNMNKLAALNILLAGLMLAYPFWKTGRLYLSIGIHAGWNYAQGGIFGLAVSGNAIRGNLISTQVNGPELWTGGAFGPEGGLLGSMGILLVVLLCYGVYRFLPDLKTPTTFDEGHKKTPDDPGLVK